MDPQTWRRTERREVTQTTDVRFSWPDLAKPGPGMAERRAAAIDKALAGERGQAPPSGVESPPGLRAREGGRAEEPRRLAAPPEADRESLLVAVNVAKPQERKV